MKFASESTRRICTGAGLLASFLVLGPACAAEVVFRVVDESGGDLEHAALALVPVGAPAAGFQARGAEIRQKDKRFIPLMTAVPTGTAINFPNLDTVRHHVYSFSPAKTFELKLYTGTPAAPVIFDKPGVVVMGCNIHDHMVAYVMVANSPWVGVSDEGGRVAMKGVPAGNYELEYWHPRWVGMTEVARKPLRVTGDLAQTLVVGNAR